MGSVTKWERMALRRLHVVTVILATGFGMIVAVSMLIMIYAILRDWLAA